MNEAFLPNPNDINNTEHADSDEGSERLRLPEIPDSADFIYVLQNKFGATRAECQNPVIKTFGLGRCAALTVFDPDSRMGALAHLSPSILMQQKMQERSASAHRENLGFDHLMSQLNKIFYILEDNGATNAKYDQRAKLVVQLICSYDEYVLELQKRLEWAKTPVSSNDVYTQQDLTAVALDTRSGILSKILPPIKGDIKMATTDILTAQLGELSITSDPRSLKPI